MTSLSIRPASCADLELLAKLEVEAGQIFRSVGMPEVAEHAPDMRTLHSGQEKGKIWVAEVSTEIAGYVVAAVVDGNAHIEQVSVPPAYARQGIGRRLIGHLEAWGSDCGFPAITLTTFCDVPWNGPYYRRLGYKVLAASEIGTDLAFAIDYEASLPGIDRSLRCAMIKPAAKEKESQLWAGQPPRSRFSRRNLEDLARVEDPGRVEGFLDVTVHP